MPRINVEDSVWGDERFHSLCEAVGDRDKALGMLVRAWRLAQVFWLKDRSLIPLTRWTGAKLSDHILEVGWGEIREGGIYMHGSEDAFAWIEQRAIASEKGVKARAEKKKLSVTEPQPVGNRSVIETEPTGDRSITGTQPSYSYSYSSSSSSSNTNKIPNTNTFPTNPIETEIPSAAVAASECNELIVKESHKVTRKKSPKEPAPTTAAFEAYSEAIKKRYGVEPARGAAVNGQLASMLRSVPADELPDLLVWYVSRCNDSSAIRARHAIRDATWRIQTLFMDWQAGSTITQAQANNMDKTSTNFNSLQLVLDRMEKKGAK